VNPVQAIYFDGQSARPQPVSIFLRGDRLIVDGEQVAREEGLADLAISEPLGTAPRVVHFADGARCEVREHAAFEQLLHEAGIGDGFVVRLQARWHWALAAVALTLATACAGYYWGLPATADWIAGRLPEQLLAGMGESTLDVLDQHVFENSELPEARQAQLTAAFEQLATPAGSLPDHRIVFRDGGPIGANAFALPDGTIVVTDQLVDTAEQDEEILGVLAHELGHLERRHSLRMLIQGSIVGFMVSWYLGDVSSVAAGLPGALLQARYSRDFEREADDYAMRMLELNGIPPVALARILARMQAEMDCDHASGSAPFRDYLSSHPATGERILRLGGTPQVTPCNRAGGRRTSQCGGPDNEYLAAFLDVHGWYCGGHYTDPDSLVAALEEDSRLSASPAHDATFEVMAHGIRIAVSPVEHGCVTVVLLQPGGEAGAIFTLNEINASLLKLGYRDTGREEESSVEGLDGSAVRIDAIEYRSGAGERAVLSYPLDKPDNFFMALTVYKF